ncbi:SlyX protein [Saccharobesus litoralis]|uniref:Protein SlyX homolog n=1 Tax=Saccharobesus litoralis TaxID=2172099 RepID=A0A2S0VW32_9ALTE|nr:SlyX family protein [Saccharobesus litoralis]AWB68418.1 SlyX protein [Saccharobesus litoralis]
MSELERRVEELETKVSFQEDTIEQLNAALASQQEEMLILKKQLTLLAQRLTTLQPDAVIPQSQEAPPPHY